MLLLHLGATFPQRKLEWLLGAQMLSFGLILLRPESTFSLSTSFDGLAALAGEPIWAIGCTLAGMLRLGALVINGGLVPTTYHLRSVTAAFSALFWFSIAYSIMQGGLPSTGLAVYPWCFVGELVCIYRASRDAKIARLVAAQE